LEVGQVAYASIEDYRIRYGEVSDVGMLQECLEDCSVVIDAELRRHGFGHSARSEWPTDAMMRVCRSMAHRVMPQESSPDIPVGATQMSVTAGSYTQSVMFGQTYGTPRMNDDERRMLGIAGARIGFGALAGTDA